MPSSRLLIATKPHLCGEHKYTFHYFKCGAKGNQLDLWVAVSQLPLFEATRDLCDKAGIDVPEVRRW